MTDTALRAALEAVTRDLENTCELLAEKTGREQWRRGLVSLIQARHLLATPLGDDGESVAWRSALDKIGFRISAWISVALDGVEADGEVIDPPLGEPVAGFVKGCEEILTVIADVLDSTAKSEPVAFQARVRKWLLACFGEAIANDTTERNHRFLEEALEVVQALGCTETEAIQLVRYVFRRPAGEPSQEVGGTVVTLAALCSANGLDMDACGEIEATRIDAPGVMMKIRAKQKAKPKFSPLPARQEPDDGK